MPWRGLFSCKRAAHECTICGVLSCHVTFHLLKVFSVHILILSSSIQFNLQYLTLAASENSLKCLFRLSRQSYAKTSYKFASNEYAAARDKNHDVPKILHFLWVFKLIPAKYLDAISAFEKNNPDYEVRIKLVKARPKLENPMIRHLEQHEACATFCSMCSASFLVKASTFGGLQSEPKTLLLVLQIYLWTDDASILSLQNRSSWKIRHVVSLNLTIPEVIEGESSEQKAGWGWIGAYTDLLRYILMKLRLFFFLEPIYLQL